MDIVALLILLTCAAIIITPITLAITYFYNLTRRFQGLPQLSALESIQQIFKSIKDFFIKTRTNNLKAKLKAKESAKNNIEDAEYREVN